MSLDQNLFTLAITASAGEAGSLDLTDPSSSTIHYRKRPNPPSPEAPYSWGLWDPLADSLLCTVTAPNAANKQKWIELHNPEVKVEFSFVGTLNFKWHFDWEGHTFEWRKDSCYLIRKPDPPVQVAVTREPSGRIRTHQVQLLDYNLNRFDIDDRKGLEIVMLAAMLTFQDYSDALRSASAAGSSNQTPSRHNSDGPQTPTKSPTDIVSALQTINRAQKNEVIVGEEGSIDDYATHCVQMLKDQTMLYIVMRPHTQDHVTKVIQVAEATKRFHYKSGGHDEELFQYVTMEDVKPEKTGPKVINLDDSSNKKKKEMEYKPPQTVTVHLSKIPMPELQPKARPSTKPTPAASSSSAADPSSSLRPWKKNNRTPSPSRPSTSPQGSSSAPNHLHKQHQPPPQQSGPNPYRYQMALYPPTGPPPSFPNEKPAKNGKNKKSNNPPPPGPPPPPNQPSPYQMPGAYPSPVPTPGAMNSGRPQNFYTPYNVPPPPGPPPAQHLQTQQPPSQPATLGNMVSSVGYSLLDKLSGKQGQAQAKH